LGLNGASVARKLDLIGTAIRGIFFGALTSCALISGASSQAQAQLMAEELRSLIQTNPRIEEQRAILRRAQESVRSARSGYLPTVTATSSLGKELVSNATTRAASTQDEFMQFKALGIQIRQVLFDGGGTENRVSSALMARDSVAYALESTVQTVMLQGITSYLNVLRLNELIRVARARERTIREQLNLETERVERGAGIEVDVLQAKSRLQLAIEARVDLEGQLRQAVAAYIQSFNTAPDITQMRLEPVPMEIIPASIDDALYVARDENPLLTGREFLARSARFTIEAERGGYLPSLSAVGRMNYQSNVGGTRNVEKDMAVLIEASWEIFSGFRTDAAVASAQESWLEQLAASDRTLRDVERQVRQAWSKYQNTSERKELLFNAVSIAQEVFVARQKLRSAGKETTLNVLDAENEVFQAEQNLIRADYDTRIAVYEMAAAMGIMTPPMMKLDVEVIKDIDFYKSVEGDVQELPALEDVQARQMKNQLQSEAPAPLPPANTLAPPADPAVPESTITPPPASGTSAPSSAEPETVPAPTTGMAPIDIQAAASEDTAALSTTPAEPATEQDSLLSSVQRLFGGEKAESTTTALETVTVEPNLSGPSVAAVPSTEAANIAAVDAPVVMQISAPAPVEPAVTPVAAPAVAQLPAAKSAVIVEDVNGISVTSVPSANSFEIPGSFLFGWSSPPPQ
jgi:outer membrane protein, adhesin transport system